MSILRVYDPPECDGLVPLDWERCRTCDGRRERVAAQPGAQALHRCPTCDGHGSLKAAALAALDTYERRGARYRHEPDCLCLTHDGPCDCDRARKPIRCEGCGHPMSEGTWEGPDAKFTDNHPRGDEALFIRERDEATALSIALDDLRVGRTPFGRPGGPEPKSAPRFYSPCDEGCRHGIYELRSEAQTVRVMDLREGWRPATGVGSVDALVAAATEARTAPLSPCAFTAVEASWRPVDVRTLGWAHDLHPEKLAVLCLRCWAARG